jgi:DNA-binding CsgD family transcriptional regulator
MQGCTTDQMARATRLSHDSIRHILRGLYQEFGVHGGAQRVKLALLLLRRFTA